ncbi:MULTISPECIES: ABC transporter permease [Streptomyces]|uniref:ABC transporter permease n=1 Tax=Streptomyces TaxID=1883 RepID=UPI0002D507AB|nr:MULTISPECIES: ABC transporter permease subunit [Streptomyces]MBP5860057.1 ABC transporter permease subunit [Streptomyces sp. LBUM 1484]MBP5871109.1 ABC transporter permease subunit [Streptomyces sp. LBUM 1485]MBP5908921.1 ABC transporter permease subunit [Streptomyces sp. LBUM 1478]MBP5927467.1 ABC transporter permease subunit [Streptomyces sp. LBUM 1479]KFG07917.1 nitrate ABC transporter permease [Streptomyces scabiei]
MRRVLPRLLSAVALPLVLVTVWWFASAGSTDVFWPPLRTILTTFPDVWTAERVRADVLPSLLRLSAGYAVAAVAGVALGTVVGLHRRVRSVCEPVLEFLRAVPPPVLVPVIMLFAGIGDTMRIAVIASGCVWPVLLNTVEGVRAVDSVLTDTARSYGITGAARLRHVVLRSASPQIFAGLRQALSIGIILMVISEMTAAGDGLGHTVVQFQRGFAIPDMWTGILVLGLLGFLLSVVFRLVERRVLGWYHGLRASSRRSW